MNSTALLTDHYELTMLDAALRTGVAHQKAHFEVFARRLPPGRSYGVVCGTGRLGELVRRFHFDSEILSYLTTNGIVSQEAATYLESFSFSGSIYGYRDGELYFPNSPVLRVQATFAEALVLETLLLSVLNYDSAIASAAARMRQIAGGKTLIEMGSRRAHELAAVAAARAAYICGFDSTSNLEAGFRYAIPTAGTSGHALILAHESEREAFLAQALVQGSQTTALVDTYDIKSGIESAIAVFGTELRSIRIDSGDLVAGTKDARVLLDSLGATKTSIVVSGDLDEYVIASLADAPIDGFGVGTKLVGGSGFPTANFVYKLVAIEDHDGTLRSVAKRSSDKTNEGAPKAAVRVYDNDGLAIEERVYLPESPVPATEPYRVLQHEIVVNGEDLAETPIAVAREHHRQVMEEISKPCRRALNGMPAIAVQSFIPAT